MSDHPRSKTRRLRPGVVIASLAVAAVVAAGLADTPLPSLEQSWSIGVYEGHTPYTIAPAADAANPVLTAADVTDVPAAFVADPFVIRSAGVWHLFFEVYNRRTRHGEIGWAVSDDLRRWRYQQIVLRERFHLSYPYVFESDGEQYLIPESTANRDVRLYRAATFPTVWQHVTTLVAGAALADPTVIRVHGRWWLFAESAANRNLNLYFADRLDGPWRPHRLNPVVANAPDEARPAGRVIPFDGRLIRFAQVDEPTYGYAVRAFAITTLTPDVFEETPVVDSFVVGPSGSGWNAGGMHHVDPVQLAPDRWFALVDGRRRTLMFGMRRFSWRQIVRDLR